MPNLFIYLFIYKPKKDNSQWGGYDMYKYIVYRKEQNNWVMYKLNL